MYCRCSCIGVWAALLQLLWAVHAQGAVVSGRILDSEGAPVGGARVFLTQEQLVRVVETQEDGVYSFDNVTVRMMELVAYKAGHALAGQTMLPLGDMNTDLVLAPQNLLEIRVINHAFKPAPGARVVRMVVNDIFVVAADALSDKGFPLLRSNDEGLLQIPMLPDGGFVKLALAHHQYATSEVAYLPVDARRRDVILYEGARLRGRVTTEGAVVAGARVVLFQAGVGGQRVFAEAISDAEGFYHVRAPMDLYLVGAHHPEYAAALPVEADLRDAETTAVADIELREPYRIDGHVLLPDGAPCPGARVLYRVNGIATEETFTNTQGMFSLHVGDAEGILRVTPPPGYMTKILSDIPVAMGEARTAQIEAIQLVELPVIRGRALFPESSAPTQLYLRSLDLPVPIHLLSDEAGGFEIRFFYQPEQPIVSFRIEHPLRFLRRDFTVNLSELGGIEVLLEEFEPDLARRLPEMGRNNLSALLDEPAPPITCVEWFNTQPVPWDELKGKVVVLSFLGWFDNSPFAMNRLAELCALHDLLRQQDDVVILGIHDGSSDTAQIQAWLDRLDIRLPLGLDDDEFTSFRKYNVIHIPQTVLVDRQGTLRYAQVEGRLLELVKALRRR